MRRLIASTMVVMLACGGGGENGESGEAAGGGEAAAVAPLGSGTITGTVNYTGEVPEASVIDMSEEPFCAEKWGAEGVTSPTVAVTDGKLANVFVRVTAGLPAGPYPMPAGDAVIDQDGCLYRPRVLGVMVGQTLVIENDDSLLHNVKAVPTENRGFNRSQPRAGMSSRESFTTPEIMVPLECSVHGWMNGYVGVVDHPYFATSDANGAFTISGLPDGTYTLEAWHETMGTQTAEVTISGGTGTVEFTYSG